MKMITEITFTAKEIEAALLEYAINTTGILKEGSTVTDSVISGSTVYPSKPTFGGLGENSIEITLKIKH